MKFYFSFLLFILINLNLSSQIVYNWQNSKEGWVSCSNCNCNLTAQSDAMAMRLYSSNARMLSGNLSANLGISGSDYNQVKVILKNPNSGSAIARLFIYPPGTNSDTCYYAFQVDTSMTGFSTYTISLDSIPTGGTSTPYDGPIARFGLRAPWGGMNFDTVFWKQMVVSNTNQVADSVNITFKVDMSQVSPNSFSTPEVNGTFNSWCGNCNSMSDSNGDNIWDVTVKLQSGDTIEYKYSADSWLIQEINNPNGSCTNGDPNFTNRVLIVPVNDTILPDVCWGSCDSCSPIGSLENLELHSLNIFPNPSSKSISLKSFDSINEIHIYDINGKLVLFKKDLNYNVIDISFLKEGSYFLLAKKNHSLSRKKFIVKN